MLYKTIIQDYYSTVKVGNFEKKFYRFYHFGKNETMYFTYLQLWTVEHKIKRKSYSSYNIIYLCIFQICSSTSSNFSTSYVIHTEHMHIHSSLYCDFYLEIV